MMIKNCIFLILSSALLGNVQAATTPAPSKTVIVFFDVLFRPNEAEIEQRIRKQISIGRGLSILLSGIPSKEEAKDELFSVLYETPLAKISIPDASWQTPYVPWEEDYKFPPIFNQSLVSANRDDEKKINQQISTTIKKTSDIKKARKPILQASANFIFQSNLMNETLEPIENMIDFLKTLKENNYTLLLIVGMSGYGWDTFLESHENAQIIQELFSEKQRYVSGKKHVLPTSPAMFDMIIREQKLNPKDCLVIGDHEHDLDYPRKIGMKAFICNPKTNDFNTFYDTFAAAIGKKV